MEVCHFLSACRVNSSWVKKVSIIHSLIMGLKVIVTIFTIFLLINLVIIEQVMASKRFEKGVLLGYLLAQQRGLSYAGLWVRGLIINHQWILTIHVSSTEDSTTPITIHIIIITDTKRNASWILQFNNLLSIDNHLSHPFSVLNSPVPKITTSRFFPPTWNAYHLKSPITCFRIV